MSNDIKGDDGMDVACGDNSVILPSHNIPYKLIYVATICAQYGGNDTITLGKITILHLEVTFLLAAYHDVQGSMGGIVVLVHSSVTTWWSLSWALRTTTLKAAKDRQVLQTVLFLCSS